MNAFLEAALIACAVSAGGTVLGAGGALAIRHTRRSLSSFLLGLAAGIVLALVVLDMIPDAWEEGGAFPFFLGLGLGAAALLWFDTKFGHEHSHAHGHDMDDSEAHEIATESLVRAGLVLAGGMAVHNLPQGIAIGSGLYSPALASLAVLLFVHNIPEGMAMAIPMKIGGVKGSRILYVCVLTAIPTVIGSLIGVAVSQISPFFISFSLAFAAGAMLCLTTRELIPHSAALGKTRYAAIAVIVGFAAGGFLAWALH